MHLVPPSQHPLNVVDVHLQLFSNIVDIQVLKIDVGSAEALQTAIGLQQVGFELWAEVEHVGAHGVEVVFFVGCYLLEDLFGLLEHLGENLFLLLGVVLGEQFEYFGEEGQKFLT